MYTTVKCELHVNTCKHKMLSKKIILHGYYIRATLLYKEVSLSYNAYH